MGCRFFFYLWGNMYEWVYYFIILRMCDVSFLSNLFGKILICGKEKESFGFNCGF